MKKNLIKSKRWVYAMAVIYAMASLSACASNPGAESAEVREFVVTEVQKNEEMTEKTSENVEHIGEETDNLAPEGILKGHFLIASETIVPEDFIEQVTDFSEFTKGFRNIRMIYDESKAMEMLENGFENLDIIREDPDFMGIFGLRWDMSDCCYEETGCSGDSLQKEFLPEKSGLYELEVVAADIYGNASAAKVYVLYEQAATTLSEFERYVTENTQTTSNGLNRGKAEEAFAKVNEQRAANGVSVLAWDESLYELAGMRAEELVSNFSHERPDGSYVGDVIIRQYGASGCGENIAANYSSTTNLINGWMNSQGHKENILNSRFNTGVMACYCHDGSYYWVNLFKQ